MLENLTVAVLLGAIIGGFGGAMLGQSRAKKDVKKKLLTLNLATKTEIIGLRETASFIRMRNINV